MLPEKVDAIIAASTNYFQFLLGCFAWPLARNPSSGRILNFQFLLGCFENNVKAQLKANNFNFQFLLGCFDRGEKQSEEDAVVLLSIPSRMLHQ